EGKNSEHFIGTIITKPLKQDNFSLQALELIDGQQRLTTIAIILKALADTTTGEYKNLRDNLINYIQFADTQDNKYLRIKHSKNDAPYFNEIMKVLEKGETIPEKNHSINRAYHFYFSAFKSLTDSERDTYSNILLKKLPVIAMFLNEEDDEQEIFDTINSLGVRLTISELLKNYIFRDKNLRNFYNSLWYNVFEEEEEDIAFWNEFKTSGRVKRTNLELLLYCFLIMETGKEVRLEKLFIEYKRHLKGMSSKNKKKFLENLKATASTYRNFPSRKDFNQIEFSETEKRVFHIIDYLEITTVYPLLLFIYAKVNDVDERNEILETLESYLVRRLVCKLTSKNYNRFFIQLINDLNKEKKISADSFENKLISYEEDSNRFPADKEFKEAFNQSYLYNKYAREILFIIALYKISNKYSDVKKLSLESHSVEHMMPKKWEENWMLKNMTDEEKSTRNRKLKTLGNLTLATQQLNSKMRNASWKKKKDLLKQYGMLSITTDYLELDDWNESEIDKRAKDLATTSLVIWQ
ncbi:unnamed protein product, partial [Ectocarpus sp. 12 AP-2014]